MSKRQMTREEFLALEFNTEVEITTRWEDEDEENFEPYLDEDGDVVTPATVYYREYGGCVAFKSGDITLMMGWRTKTEGTSYREAHEFSFLPDDTTPELCGVELVDDDGDPLDHEAVNDIAHELWREESWEDSIDLPEAGIDEIEEEGEMTEDMERFRVRQDNGPDLRFVGELIADVQSEEKVGRSRRMKLWRTKGGRYVCQDIGITYWVNEVDRYQAQVCETEAEVIAFYGQGWLAKRLYEEAEIDNSVEVG
jgi:hypothetical protein